MPIIVDVGQISRGNVSFGVPDGTSVEGVGITIPVFISDADAVIILANYDAESCKRHWYSRSYQWFRSLHRGARSLLS